MHTHTPRGKTYVRFIGIGIHRWSVKVASIFLTATILIGVRIKLTRLSFLFSFVCHLVSVILFVGRVAVGLATYGAFQEIHLIARQSACFIRKYVLDLKERER